MEQKNFMLKLTSLVISVFLLMLFLNSAALAKYESIKGIELEDGTVIVGKILESTNDYVKIQTQDGKVSTYRFDDVVSFLREGDEELSPDWKPESKPTENLLQFDLRISYFDYKEDVPAPLKSTESGWIPGAAIGWTRTKPGAVYARAFMEFDSGDVKYDGTTQSGTPVTDSSSDQFLFRVEANIGYTFGRGNIAISPYTGFGYRYWKRGDSKVVNSVAFIREEYEWMYIPVGLRAVVPIGEKVTIEPNFGARFMFWGRMTAHLSDFGYDHDPTFDLGNKPGYFVETPVRYRLSRNWSLSLTPWYEYSAIGQSDIESARIGPFIDFFYEPSSRTHQYGFNIGAGYSF